MAPILPVASLSAPLRRALRHVRHDALSYSTSAANHLHRRQTTNNPSTTTTPATPSIIPSTYSGIGANTSPGTIIGIVLGSVLGFMFIVMMLWWAVYAQHSTTPTPGETTVVVRQDDVNGRRHHHHPRRSEMSDVRRSSHSTISPRRRSHSLPRRTQIVEERVVEERMPAPHSPASVRRHSPAPSRSKSRRRSREEEVVIEYEDGSTDISTLPPRRSRSRRKSSGYRPVDPDRYAGGDYAKRPVSRRYS